LLDVLERLRVASIAQDAGRLTALYAEDAVHEFPFTTPGGPTRLEGRAAIAEFLATVYRSLPLQYTEYRTVAVHHMNETTLVVEQEALGVNTQTGARFVLPNVAVIGVDPQGLIASYRDYVNPVAVAEALGDARRL
jgi:ketosteroid isomerase-like protein